MLRALVGEQLREELIEHGGRLPEERRLVSALFADLSGFTTLAGRLDPETLALVVDPILAGLVRIVKRGEGHVGAFAGDALLCYFGAPVAHEDDATRAVQCAHEMLEEFPALLAVAPSEAADLTLRIGVDTGAVMARLVAGDIRTDYNILGDSVNMAQRLQSNAPPGALVVGETTYRLTADGFDYRDIGPLQVKGRTEPLPAYLLLGPRERNLQRRGLLGSRVYGRQVELAKLSAIEQRPGSGGIAIVADAGTGKSRLLQEARAGSARAWYEGGCAPQERSRSYRPWAGALASYVADGPASDGLRIITGRNLDERLEALPPAVRRDVVAEDVTALLREAAPCTVVLEDLHWADQPSLDLLDDVLFEVGDADVLLIATSREKVSASAELDLLELGPLDRADVAALLADLLSGVPPDDLIDEVVRRSGGNPLYVGELAFAIRDRGLVSLVDGGVLVTAATGLATALDLVPDSLEGLIGARIDALPAALERALTIAAVLGAPIEEELVVALSTRLAEPSSEVRAALAGLREEGLLVDVDFVHALVQSTAYLRTTRARRRRLHLAASEVGSALVPAGELPDFLARHLYLAGAAEGAIAALGKAAEAALSRGAQDEALVHLYRELELRRSDDVAEEYRADLPERLVATGELLELLGRYDEAESHFREAIALGAGAVAYRGLAGCLRRLGRYDEVVTTADKVMVQEIEAPLRVRLSWEKAAALAALGSVDQSLAALLPGDDPAAEARQDLVRSYCLIQRSEPDAAEGVLNRALPVLEAAGDTAAVVHGMRNLGWVRSQQQRYAEAVQTLEDALRLARRNGLTEEVMACLLNLGAVAGDAGRPELELRYAQEAVVQCDRMRHSFNRAATRNNLAYALIEAGRAGEAVAVASRALELARAHGLSGVTGTILHTRAMAHLQLGHRDDAVKDAAAAEPLVRGTQFEGELREFLEGLENDATPGDGPPGAT